MINMWSIKSQKDGSEFGLCSKNKYVKSLDWADVTLQRWVNDEESFRCEGRGNIRPHYSKSLARKQIFQGILVWWWILNHLVPWEVAEGGPSNGSGSEWTRTRAIRIVLSGWACVQSCLITRLNWSHKARGVPIIQTRWLAWSTEWEQYHRIAP